MDEKSEGGDEKLRISLAIISAVVLTIFVAVGINECRYTMDAEIVEASEESIVLEDIRGHLWEMGNPNCLNVGAKLLVTFDDHHTMRVEDDEIIKIRLKIQ